jgi:hypothetical protein
MPENSEVGPRQPVFPLDKPPDNSRPTSAQLKADINSGSTGDKVEGFDPGMAPLGTDDEAAGTAPSAKAVKDARAAETDVRWKGAGAPASQPTGPIPAFRFSLIVALVAGGLVAGVLFALW